MKIDRVDALKVMKFGWAPLFVLVGWYFLFRPFSYAGEGSLEEYGWGRMKFRSYSLSLGQVRLDDSSSNQYRISSLPTTHKPFTFGLLLDATSPIESFDARIHLKCIEEAKDRVVFDFIGDIQDWDRSESGGLGTDYFLYKLWQTQIKGNVEYPVLLFVEVLAANDQPLDHNAVVFGRGGGWK